MGQFGKDWGPGGRSRIGVQAGGGGLGSRLEEEDWGPGGRRRIGVQVGGGGLGSRREEAQIH